MKGKQLYFCWGMIASSFTVSAESQKAQHNDFISLLIVFFKRLDLSNIQYAGVQRILIRVSLLPTRI